MRRITAVFVLFFIIFIGFINITVADTKYFGVVTEIDKGEGVFVLTWDYWHHTPEEWGGMIAEFKRRHSDLEVATFSIIVSAHASALNGVVILTVPKNRCPQ